MAQEIQQMPVKNAGVKQIAPTGKPVADVSGAEAGSKTWLWWLIGGLAVVVIALLLWFFVF